jgi:lipopolysaccharide heptosyltransferase I
VRLLIVRLSALGDVVHALPLAANAHAAGARVGWVVERGLAPLLEGNPAIERIFPAHTKGWRRNPFHPAHVSEFAALARDLADFGADATLDPQGLWKSAVVARLAGAPVVSFAGPDRRERSSSILVDRQVPIPAGVSHVVDQNLLLLSELQIPAPCPAPDARYLLETRSPAAETFLASLGARPFVLYHPGAARPDKTWGEDRYADLAARIEREAGLSPVVSWGPGDEERMRRLRALLPSASAPPPLDLSGLANVIARASLFVAGDTGPAHLADSLGVPTLGLFGPSARTRNVPERNRPYRGSALSYDDSTPVGLVAERAIEILREGGG